MKTQRLLGLALVALSIGACVTNNQILKNIEESRGPDARTGVLSAELDSRQRARLELLGRTSAPTRYTERVDANRLRVVALNFGGVQLGQCADPSGNLSDGICNMQTVTVTNPTRFEPEKARVPEADLQARESLQKQIDAAVKALESAATAVDVERIRAQLQILHEKQAALPTTRGATQLHAGMFRQFSTQVGTTVEADVAIGPVSNTTRQYHSRNFLVLEWRRHYEERLIQPSEQLERLNAELGSLGDAIGKVAGADAGLAKRLKAGLSGAHEDVIATIEAIKGGVQSLKANPATLQLGVQLEQLITDLQQYADWVKNGPDTTHVFAIERGIAVRIIFDVQLTTTDSQLSASFGIANLSAALARNEANVEVSYEVTGTAIDPLPEEAIIITSVNEYLEAFKKFHAAVSLISRAWEAHAKGESKVKVPAKGTEDPETLLLDARMFSLAQLAYYVQGPGVGDNYALTKNAEMCQDMQLVEDHLRQELERKRAQMDAIDCVGDSRVKARKTKDEKAELRQLGREFDRLLRNYEDIRARMAENACQRACEAEKKRLEVVCHDHSGNVTCTQLNDGSALLRCIKPDESAVPSKVKCNKDED